MQTPIGHIHELHATTYEAAHAEAAALALGGMAGLFILQCLHDDGCPSVETHEYRDCVPPCCPSFVLMDLKAATHFAQFDAMLKARCN